MKESFVQRAIARVIIVLLCMLVAILFSYLIWPPGEL